MNSSPIHWLDDNGVEHVGVVDRLVIVVPMREPTVPSLARLVEVVEGIAAGGKVPGLLLSFPKETVPPSSESRAVVQDALGRLRPLLGATAVVVQGDGFAGAAQRGAATAVFMFAGLQHVHVCATPIAGVQWVGQRIGLQVDRGAVAAEILERTLHPLGAGR